MADEIGLKSWQWAALAFYGLILLGACARVLLSHVTIRRTPFLTAGSPRWDAPKAPKVSILVPAKDEAANLEDCLRSLLAQDYPNLEVLVVDDRSTDDTAAIAQRVAERDGRVRVLRVRNLPPGWTGKTHALHVGQYKASGDWLLFVDADATLHPNCVSVAVRDAADNDAGLLSLLPRMEMRSFWERVFQPLAATMLMVFCPIPWANDRAREGGGFANGQFLLFRRTAYDAIGGHRAVRDKFVEDVNLGRLVKQNRLGLRVAAAPEVLGVRMYASLAQIMKGWSRIFYAAADANRAKIAALGTVFFLLSVLPYLVIPTCLTIAAAGAAGAFTWTLLACAVTHDLIQGFAFALVYRAGGTPLRLLAWRWLASGLLLVVLVRTFRLCKTHQVVWRGTTYAGTLSQAASASFTATARPA
jgi:cellulose synthase/poly-beta-1,6-N-acetylglucosamine synthase-like glycosyltransferase